MDIGFMGFELKKWEFFKENIDNIIASKVIEKMYVDYRISDATDGSKVCKLKLTPITVLAFNPSRKLLLNYETSSEYIVYYDSLENAKELIDKELLQSYSRHCDEFLNQSKNILRYQLNRTNFNPSETTKEILSLLSRK